MGKEHKAPAGNPARRIWPYLAVLAVLAAVALMVLGPRLAVDRDRATLGLLGRTEAKNESGSYDYEETAPSQRSLAAPAPGIGLDSSAARMVRKILYTATLEIEVKRAAEAAEAMGETAKALGGYVQSSSIAATDERKHAAQLVLRVPAARLDAFIQTAGGTGRILRKELNGQDVTEEYVDLEARLKNWQSEERRYVAILAQAKTVAEVLAVQAEIGRVRENIEQIQGKMRYYDQHAELATVNLSLFEGGRPAGKPWILEELSALGLMLYGSFRALLLVLLALVPWGLAAWVVWLVVRRLLPSRKGGA